MREPTHQRCEIATLTCCDVVSLGGRKRHAPDCPWRQLQSSKCRQPICPRAVPTQGVGCGGECRSCVGKGSLSLVQRRKQVGQDHEPIEVAKHRRHQVAPDSIHIRIEAGLHEVRERAASGQRKELRPGRGSARRWHQEASGLEKRQSSLIAHSPQHFGVEPVSRQCQRLVCLHAQRQAAYESRETPGLSRSGSKSPAGAEFSLTSPQSSDRAAGDREATRQGSRGTRGAGVATPVARAALLSAHRCPGRAAIRKLSGPAIVAGRQRVRRRGMRPRILGCLKLPPALLLSVAFGHAADRILLAGTAARLTTPANWRRAK